MPLKKSEHQTLINTQSSHNDNGERNWFACYYKNITISRGVFLSSKFVKKLVTVYFDNVI